MLLDPVSESSDWKVSLLVGRWIAPAAGRAAWLRYGLAVGLPSVGFLITWDAFDLQRAPYFSVFMTTVVITSLFGGWKPGLLNTLISSVLGFLAAAPAWTIRLAEREDAIRILLFTALGVFLSLLVGVVGELQRRLNSEKNTLMKVFYDVSAARAEAELERQRLREILAYAPAAIGVMRGPEHRWEYVNDEYVRVTGRQSASEFVGRTVAESLPEIETQPFIGLLDKVYSSGIAYVGCEMKAHLNRRIVGKQDDAYFDFVYQPLRDLAGRVDGILVHAIEVTDRVRVKEKIEEAQQARRQLATIVEYSDDAIISKDLQGIVTSWNPAAERMFGYSAKEMIGKSITTIIPPELHHEEASILATLARGERLNHFETTRVTQSGQRLMVSLTISPIIGESGHVTGAAKIIRDITRQKVAEKALHQSERLASVGRLATTIAHEINNPLEAVTNLVYLARESAVGDVKEFLRLADEELGRIAYITRQTLGFYRETKGASKTRLGGLLETAIPVVVRRRNKPVEISREIRQDPEIYAIPSEIRQLMANLLSNSVDALGTQGRIRVRVSSGKDRSGAANKCGVRLVVADSGSGIPPALRSKLFEPFFTTKEDIGTGLGLWICRNVVEKHRGSIRVKSSTIPGKSGTVFSVFLPSLPETLKEVS